MKCESTDLEIETIVNRIKNEDMDLQPDFQRGEIWTLQKKQKLIDSNFAHRFCLCTLKIQYLAVIQLSKVCCYAA